MKTLLMTLLGLWGAGVMALSDPAESYDPTPLPSGALINRAGDYAEWQIKFAYEQDKPQHPSAAGAPVPVDTSLPRSLIVTRTKPFYHAALTYAGGSTTECWYDGAAPYIVSSSQPTPMELMLDTPGVHMPPYLDYIGNHDFPDVEWASRSNYLGTQKGTTYWVFHQGGTKLWVDSTTRLPVRWQTQSETRTFEFHTPPAEKLVFPPEVEKLSKMNQYIHTISNNHPRSGA